MQRIRRYTVALLALASFEASAAEVAAGQRVFERHCAECHAPGIGHPGTQQLGWTRGADRAVLEQRSDLPAAYISVIVRNGLMEMPAFRPTEINDAELRQLAAYLARPRKSRKVR
jgi:mono/diheme cytochrome c family protein